MKRKILFVSIALIALAIAGCQKSDNQIQVQNDSLSLKSAQVQVEYAMVPNEILVKFKNGIDASKKASILDKIGGKLKEKILTKMMEKEGDKEGISLLTISGTVVDAIAKAKELPDVEYAEPNYIYTHQDVSNDLYFTTNKLWGMYSDVSSPANQFGSHAADAWAKGHTGSPSVYVGIIDEGAMYYHVDLNGNFGNPNEIIGGTTDNDGNGKAGDYYGWNFVDNNNIIYTAGLDQHGTHVSGTIDAIGGNNIGVAGVCWNIKLLDAKFLGPNGGTTANAVKAVDYFTTLKLLPSPKGLNIVATNNSWGGGGYSQALYDAISRANAAGILFIAAAGNSGTNNDNKASFPADYSISNKYQGKTYPGLNNMIVVAAIDSKGLLASWSQYGAKSVHLGAPGVDIYSTLPTNTYGSYSGTSMATPHVTGAAALYASTHAGATATDIKKAILDAAKLTPTTSLTGKCVTGGRLNVSGF